ncbi:MAG: hypothetical protein ACR2J8_13325 [Thermomicrobiales bacterium]
MFDQHDRRAIVQKLTAGIGAATLLLTGRSAATASTGSDPEIERRRDVRRTFEGNLVNPVYTKDGAGDTKRYIITAQGGSGFVLHDARNDKKVSMSDSRLYRYVHGKTGGKFPGDQCMRIQGINWRIYGMDYQEKTNTWKLKVRVCDTNPDARPDTSKSAESAPSASGLYDQTSGCGCDCGIKCWQCKKGARCGSTAFLACNEG